MKVILLLAVILIFSYVNTKKSHIEKVEKIREKEALKEGNTRTNNTGTNNTGTNNTGTNNTGTNNTGKMRIMFQQ